MKHCVGILAHKPKPQLKWLIQDLIEQGFRPIIHLDSKFRTDLLSVLGNYDQYVVPTSIPVNRGHNSIIKASLLLMEESLKHDFDYFHLISAEDVLVKSIDEINQILGDNKFNYINHNKLPLQEQQRLIPEIFSKYSIFKDQIPLDNYKHFSLKNGMALVSHYQFPSNPIIKKVNTLFGQFRSYWRLYHLLFKRKTPNTTFYLGSAWFSVKKSLIEHFVKESADKRAFLNYFDQVSFPDEIYFHSLTMSSEFRDTVVNSDLRFIDWLKSVNQGPSILNTSYFDAITRSNALFARKWEIVSELEFNQIKEMRNANR